MLDLGGERGTTAADGPISGKSRGRPRAPGAAGGAWLLGIRSARTLRTTRLPGLLGKAARPVFRGQAAIWRTEGPAESVRDLQPAVSDPDQGWTAHPELSGSADQAAEGRKPEVALAERSGASEKRRTAV